MLSKIYDIMGDKVLAVYMRRYTILRFQLYQAICLNLNNKVHVHVNTKQLKIFIND